METRKYIIVNALSLDKEISNQIHMSVDYYFRTHVHPEICKPTGEDEEMFLPNNVFAKQRIKLKFERKEKDVFHFRFVGFEEVKQVIA